MGNKNLGVLEVICQERLERVETLQENYSRGKPCSPLQTGQLWNTTAAIQEWLHRAWNSSLWLALWVCSVVINKSKTHGKAKHCQRGRNAGRELWNKWEQSEKERWNLV